MNRKDTLVRIEMLWSFIVKDLRDEKTSTAVRQGPEATSET
jgi:hypothetical protein